MPYVYFDKAKKRYFVQLKKPADVQSFLGKTPFKHNFPQAVDRRAANRLSIEIVEDFEAQIAAARSKATPTRLRLASDMAVEPLPRTRYVVLSRTLTTVQRPGQTLELTGTPARLITGRHGETLLIQHLAVEVQAEPLKPAIRVEAYTDSVNDWGVRLHKGQTAIDRRMSKMRKLFEWLATQRQQRGFDDMNAVTSAELLRYEDEVLMQQVRAGEWKHPTVRDHLIDIKAQFGHAHRRLKIDANPALVLRTYDPDDGENDGSDEWEDFTPGERIDILTTAAASDNPVVKFCNWLAAVHGSRVGELVEARTDHIYFDEETGLWVFNYTLRGRPRGRRIKTAFSARKLPIPQVIVEDLGLLAYVERVRRDYHDSHDGDLFPMLTPRKSNNRLNTHGSRVLMDFLRDEIGIKNDRKVFHSWRATVATALEGKVPETRGRYVTGHAPRTRGERYIKHHLPELAEAIAKIGLPPI